MDILEKLDEKTRKVPKEGLSIICSTKKNTTICWNKGSISPYNKNIIQHADFGRCAGYSDHKVAQAEQTCAFGVSIFAAVAPYIYAKIEDTQRTIG